MSLKVTQPNITCDEITSKCMCPKCSKLFATKGSLTRHINGGYCIEFSRNQVAEVNSLKDELKVLRELVEKSNQTAEKSNQIAEKYQQIVESCQHNPSAQRAFNLHQNNLNVMCLGSKDNMLDILTTRHGHHKALTFVKDSALNRLKGDCTILEKVYILGTDRPAIMYANGSKIQYVYYDENNNRVVETNVQVMAKKLADNLQRTYLKGMGSLHIDLADNLRDDHIPSLSKKLPSIEAHDIQTMNERVHELQDEKYQKKVLKSLKIPYESDILHKAKHST